MPGCFFKDCKMCKHEKFKHGIGIESVVGMDFANPRLYLATW